MRIFQFHNGASAPADGQVMEPRTNTVGIQAVVTGAGTVTATVQPKARVVKNNESAWENVGAPLVLSGTNVAVGSITLTDFVGAQLIADLTACSCTSFRCDGAEADR